MLHYSNIIVINKCICYSSIILCLVGAGSAGSVVAARLSENPAHSVLLIEAGGRPSPLFSIPIIAPMLQSTPYDWQYKTEPQDGACLGLTEKV